MTLNVFIFKGFLKFLKHHVPKYILMYLPFEEFNGNYTSYKIIKINKMVITYGSIKV